MRINFRNLILSAGIFFLPLLSRAQEHSPQLYNMNFDNWSKRRGEWRMFLSSSPESDRVWDTANHGLSLLGINGTVPESEIVAVRGEGKKAAKLSSKKVLWAFASGNCYTGKFLRIVDWSGAELSWGVPFDGRPKSLSGYYYYIPGIINYASGHYKDKKGQTDSGVIQVLLTDWEKPFIINSNMEQYVDMEHDPHIIGYGSLVLTHKTKGYVKFDIPITYRNDRKPKYVVLIAASSRFGDYFTGSDESVLYLDEFRFNY